MDGRYAPVTRWYAQGSFALHRGIHRSGWTVTHLRTREAVLQRLPSLRAARYVADELDRLTPRWGALKRPYDLWDTMHRVFNPRELHAVATFIARLRRERGCL